MKKHLLLMGMVALAAASQASFTMATFADPASDGTTPMFTWDKAANTLVGSWALPGLTMETPGFIGGGSQQNVQVSFDKIALTSIVVNSVYSFGAGQIKFYTTDINNPFMTATFSSGTFLANSALGASKLAGDGVTFTGANVPTDIVDEQFAFSFANTMGGNDKDTYTASFTSSASVVPEPCSLMMLGLAATGLMRARKRSQR